MSQEIESPANLLKKAVNVHGELHLDKVRTDALVRWVDSQEHHMIELEKNVAGLLEALKPVIGVDAFSEIMKTLK